MFLFVFEHASTCIMEVVADHSKTYHCSKGYVEPLVFCSLCQILLKAGTLVSVKEHLLTTSLKLM